MVTGMQVTGTVIEYPKWEGDGPPPPTMATPVRVAGLVVAVSHDLYYLLIARPDGRFSRIPASSARLAADPLAPWPEEN